jgi:hypothetical protein
VIGLEPEDVGYLYYLSQEKLGDYSTNGLIGSRIEDVRIKFKMHPTYPVQKQWKGD